MNEQPQAHFEGYARVEVMGHQTHIGFVRTEAFGQAVLFRIDTPPLPAREYVLEAPEWSGSQMLPVGSKVQRPEVPGGTVLVGSGSIYRILPCTQEAALAAIEAGMQRPLKLLELPPGKTLAAPIEQPELRDYECCDGNPEEGHDAGCPNAEADECPDDQESI